VQGAVSGEDGGNDDASDAAASADSDDADAEDEGASFRARPFGFEIGVVELGRDPAAVRASVRRVAAALRRVAPLVGTPAWRRLQQRCMRADVGWDVPADCWVDLLEEVARDP
jgi:hypothetical protein